MANLRKARKALIEAIESGDLDKCECLLDSHPELVDSPNSHGNTPIRVALSSKQLHIAKRLAVLGADVHQLNRGGSSIMEVASRSGSADAVHWLISLGLSASIFDYCAIGELERVEQLLQQDASVVGKRDRRMLTPLHWASQCGQIAVIRQLVDMGAEVNAQDKNGRTPLETATRARQREAAQILESIGAR